MSPSGFGPGEPAAAGRRAPEYRAATSGPSDHERSVPLGRGVQHVDQVGDTDDTTGRYTGEHQRAKRDYRPAGSKPPFRAPSEMGTGQREVSYRAVDGPQMGEPHERNVDGVTAVSEPRSRKKDAFRPSGTREFATQEPAAGQSNEQSGFTAVDSRDAHGGRRSIHRRKTSDEKRQNPVPVEIPIPAPIATSADDSMDRTRMLDVSGGVVEKTEMIQQSDLDEAVRAAGRMVGGVPASEHEEEARTRVVRRTDDFDALLQGNDSQQLQRTEAVSPVALQAQPRGLPTPMPIASPNPSPRQAPDPSPRRAARAVPEASAPGGAAGPSPLPRRGGGASAAGPSPSPRPSRRAEPVPSPSPMPSGSAPSPRRGGPRSSHADYFEAGIDEDVDLTDASPLFASFRTERSDR